MQSKSASKQLHRIPAGLAVVIALVLLVATVGVVMLLAIDRSTDDIQAARKPSIAVVHPRANPRFSEINELHAVSDPSMNERDWKSRATIDRLDAELLAKLRAANSLPGDATINQFDRMKFFEMNALPSDAALVPPTMEMYADRQ